MRENLYFIAILPPDKISEEINFFKRDFASRFNSKAALKVMPHITLKAPFKLPAYLHDDTLEWFTGLPVTISSFLQDLNDFGAFQNKQHPVIYVNPVMNTSLGNLQRQVLEGFREAYPKVIIMSPDFRFKPHITIAYRDLAPVFFEDAWKEYASKKYSARFEVKDFHLLQHNGREWKMASTYPFAANE